MLFCDVKTPPLMACKATSYPSHICTFLKGLLLFKRYKMEFSSFYPYMLDFPQFFYKCSYITHSLCALCWLTVDGASAAMVITFTLGGIHQTSSLFSLVNHQTMIASDKFLFPLSLWKWYDRHGGGGYFAAHPGCVKLVRHCCLFCIVMTGLY